MGWMHKGPTPLPYLPPLFPAPAPLFPPPRSAVKLTKKRALSISPLSDASLDLQTVIRTSPSSLVAFINSRCASPGGSYSSEHLCSERVLCHNHTFSPCPVQSATKPAAQRDSFKSPLVCPSQTIQTDFDILAVTGLQKTTRGF